MEVELVWWIGSWAAIVSAIGLMLFSIGYSRGYEKAAVLHRRILADYAASVQRQETRHPAGPKPHLRLRRFEA